MTGKRIDTFRDVLQGERKMRRFALLLLMFMVFMIAFGVTAAPELWSAHYNNELNGIDYAQAVATDPSGNVYVTGTSEGNGNFDYYTIKYNMHGTKLWEVRYDGPGYGRDSANAIAVDDRGNVYVTGESSGLDTAGDYCTIKYDTNGSQLWVARYNGPVSAQDCPNAIAIDSNGNVYVTGFSAGINSYDYCTIKYDPNGNQLWVARYDGPIHGYDDASSLALDNNGNIYVTGRSTGVDDSFDYCTIKYSTNGAFLWEARYNGTGNHTDTAEAIAVDSYGNVYVTGGSYGIDTYFDYCTIKYDTYGVEQWCERYDGENKLDTARAIAVDIYGNVYVTGSITRSTTGADYCTIKYSSSGIMLWEERYNGPGNWADNARAIALDNNGNVYITGESIGIDSGTDYCTIKYSNNGIKLWDARYDGISSENDNPTAITVDNNDNVYVTGSSNGYVASCPDYCTIKYSSDGTQLWEARYSGLLGGDDSAYAIATDNNGNIYVTGHIYTHTGYYDYCTIKYNSSGDLLWVKTYNGPANDQDFVQAIAVDDDGNVYVTGGSTGVSSKLDFCTIKYDTNGNELWVARYNGPLNQNDSSHAITIDGSGNVYVTGVTASDILNDYCTIKYDKNGNELWVATYNGPANGSDVAYAIAVDDHDDVYVTGSSYTTDDDLDYCTVKYYSSGVQAWVSTFGGSGNTNDSAFAIALDNYLNVYVTGSIHNGTNTDYCTIKYNYLGVQQWVAIYDGPGNGYDSARALAVDNRGVYVTGNAYNYHSCCCTIMYDALTGNQNWIALHDIPENSNSYANSLDLDSVGNVYVAGLIFSVDRTDCCTIKYDNSGTELWVATYDGPASGNDFLNAIVVDNSGNVYVTGGSTGIETGTDFCTLKYDGIPPTGSIYINSEDPCTTSASVTLNILALDSNPHSSIKMRFSNDHKNWTEWEDYSTTKQWTLSQSQSNGNRTVYVQFKDDMGNISQTYSDDIHLMYPGNWAETLDFGFREIGEAIAVDTSGNAYIAVGLYHDILEFIAILKIDTSGEIVWNIPYSGANRRNCTPLDIALDSTGNIYVLGKVYTETSGSDDDYLILKYNSNGDLQWERIYDGSIGGLDIPVDMAVDPSGDVYVTGYIAAGDAYQCATVKLDTNGNWLWESRYFYISNDKPSALAVDAYGNAYITGRSWNGADYDCFTIKYRDSDGYALWAARYAGESDSHEMALAITVDLYGNTYITGNNGGGFITIKYDSNGTQQWVRDYGYSSRGPVNMRICNGPYGNVYVAGSQATPDSSHLSPTCKVLKYSADGTLIWSTDCSSVYGRVQYLSDMFVDSSGNVYVTGLCDALVIVNLYDAATMKLDSNGEILWGDVFSLSKSSVDGAMALAVAPNRLVYVVGTTIDLQYDQQDILFLKYDGSDPTGTIQINGGAVYTTDVDVILDISATDTGTGVYEMRFSDNGAIWNEWESYAANKIWPLVSSDPGTKLVFAQFKDRMGNLSLVVGDTIFLGTPITIDQAKYSKPSSNVVLTGLVVSAVFQDCAYAQDSNIPMGIKIQGRQLLAIGDCIDICGSIGMIGSEKIVSPNEIKVYSSDNSLFPLGMNNKSIGGGDWMYDPILGYGQKGITGASGLNNIGLLVKTWGKVTSVDPVTPPAKPAWFTIDDGSGVDLKVAIPSYIDLPVIVPKEYVAVTGIASCEESGDNLFRLLKIRKQDDVTRF